jgi:hypothetical protein
VYLHQLLLLLPESSELETILLQPEYTDSWDLEGLLLEFCGFISFQN